MKQLLRSILIFPVCLLVIELMQCESSDKFYRPDLPEQICTVAIIDADDTTSFTYQNPYTHPNYLRYISIEKSFQSEYSEAQDDTLKTISFSIFSENEELLSVCIDSNLRNLEYYKLPRDIEFNSGEKYFLKAQSDGVNDISSEIFVPEPAPSLKLISVHKETEPGIKFSKINCHNYLDDSIKYAVLDISFSSQKGLYYAILLEGYGINLNLPPGILGFLDFSVRNNYVHGFDAIFYGLKMSHLNCSGDGPPLLQSRVKAFFIDGENIPGDMCNLTLSAKFNDGYSLYHFLTSFRIKLLSVPRDLYIFEKSLYTYERNYVDPFSEPVFLNGNIKNGNGIFAICRSSEVTKILPFPPIF